MSSLPLYLSFTSLPPSLAKMQLSLSLLSLAITSVAFAAPRPIADDVVLQPFKSLNKFCKDDSTTVSVDEAHLKCKGNTRS